MSEKRYELTFLVGPCTQKEAEDLLVELSGLNGVRALGGAGSLTAYEEDSEELGSASDAPVKSETWFGRGGSLTIDHYEDGHMEAS
jgi:hypothetical protein